MSNLVPLSAKLNIYFAGKIGKNDWRHPLLMGLYPKSTIHRLSRHNWADGDMPMTGFSYTGPFFRSCDHGCYHGPGTHGMAMDHEGCGCNGDTEHTRNEVIQRNRLAIARADVVFAYITEPDCIGTIFELGLAVAAKKRMVMAFAPGFDAREFWFVHSQPEIESHFEIAPDQLRLLLQSVVVSMNVRRAV